MLLVFGAPCQLRLLAGQEHGRTIPLATIESTLDDCCGLSCGLADVAFNQLASIDLCGLTLGFEMLRHEPRDSSLSVVWIAREH